MKYTVVDGETLETVFQTDSKPEALDVLAATRNFVLEEETKPLCPVSGQAHEECESGDRTDFHIEWHFDRMVEDGELIKNADGTYSEGTLKGSK